GSSAAVAKAGHPLPAIMRPPQGALEGPVADSDRAFFIGRLFHRAGSGQTHAAMLKIATWNINSVRLRIDMVCRFLGEAKPDVLCLQEIKCRDGEFPAKAFKAAGYKHMHVVGQK